MKNISIKWFACIVLATLMVACEKKENQIFLESSTPPALTASTAVVELVPDKENSTAITFNWTNPNYTFTTGINSLDVNYTLEIDTVGGNFASSNRYKTTIGKDLTKSYTVTELNSILGNSMLLTKGRLYNLESRITANLAQTSAPSVSNIVQYTARPFAPPPKVQVPTTGELYLVGDATAGGWTNPVPVPSQKFTKLSDTKYEIIVALAANKYYLMLPQNGSWDSKYAVVDNTLPGLAGGGDFVFRTSGGQDIPSPGEAGNYKITADFQLGKFTVVKQ